MDALFNADEFEKAALLPEPEPRITEEQSRDAARMAEGIGCKLPVNDVVRMICEEYCYWSDADVDGGVSIGAIGALANIIGRLSLRNKFEPLRELVRSQEAFKPKYSQAQILDLVQQGKVSIWDAAAYQFIPQGEPDSWVEDQRKAFKATYGPCFGKRPDGQR